MLQLLIFSLCMEMCLVPLLMLYVSQLINRPKNAFYYLYRKHLPATPGSHGKCFNLYTKAAGFSLRIIDADDTSSFM